MPSLVGVGGEIKITMRTFDEFTDKVREATRQMNRMLAFSYQKTGGTFIHCTWKTKVGHKDIKCTYKIRIARRGAYKMRRHFAKEHLGEL